MPPPQTQSHDDELPGLGRLEHRVMAVLWQGRERSVRHVQAAFAGALARALP